VSQGSIQQSAQLPEAEFKSGQLSRPQTKDPSQSSYLSQSPPPNLQGELLVQHDFVAETPLQSRIKGYVN
jgi:hypothetical protein